MADQEKWDILKVDVMTQIEDLRQQINALETEAIRKIESAENDALRFAIDELGTNVNRRLTAIETALKQLDEKVNGE